MLITNLSLRNWRNFKNFSATFEERTFVIGPNASGKSNLLDAFRFLRDLASRGLLAAVDIERGGVSAIRCSLASKYSNIDLTVDLQDKDGAKWQYLVVISQDNLRRPTIKQESVQKNGVSLLVRPNADDVQDPERLRSSALEQVGENKQFRQLAEFFKSVAYLHLLPQVVRDPKGFTPSPVTDDPFGRDFMARLWNVHQRVRDSRLKKISRALAYAVPGLESLEVESDPLGGVHLAARFRSFRPHASKRFERDLSDGTLRLLGMMWAVFEGEGPLLLEEPEISLNPEVVKHIPAMFERMQRSRKTRRQILISTHSKDLLSDIGISAQEVCRLTVTENGTELEPASDQERSSLSHGLSVAEVLLPRAAPHNAAQLALSF
jgi:predicted ATPase